MANTAYRGPIRAASFLAIGLLLTGCMTTGEFSCAHGQSAPGCYSTSQVYEMTNGPAASPSVPYQQQDEPGWLEHRKQERYERSLPHPPAHQIATHDGALVLAAPPTPQVGAVEPALALGGSVPAALEHLPVGGSAHVARSPAQVMRIWIAPWTDDAGDLHMPGYVYSEIKSRRWSIGGDVRTHEQSMFDPNGPWSPNVNR